MVDLHPWGLHGFTGAQADALSDFEASAVSIDSTGRLTTGAEAEVIIIDGGSANG